MKRFRIKSERSKMWFWVYVYDSIYEMRKDSHKYAKVAGLDETYEGTIALVHPYEHFEIGKDGSEKKKDGIGIIRFSKTHVNSTVVSHEIVHAAMWNYRLHYGRGANFGKENSEKEENFAHLYGQLFADINRQFYKFGIWK